jgi:hypothetical protein
MSPLNRQGRPEKFHSRSSPEFRVLQGPTIRASDLPKEFFDLAGWRERHDYTACSAPFERPDMGNAPRSEDRITSFQRELLSTDFKREFAFKDIKPFVLVGMQMAAWAAPVTKNILSNEQTSAGLRGPHLETDEVIADSAVLAEAILPRHDRTYNGPAIHREPPECGAF